MPSSTADRIGPIEGIWQSRFQAWFLALRQQLPPHLLTHRLQRIEWLVVKLGPPAHFRFADLPEPLLRLKPPRHTSTPHIDLPVLH